MGITVAADDQALASLVNSMSQSGAIGDRPAEATVLAGSFYYDTTNSILYQEQSGTWTAILQVRTLSNANETVAAGYYAATTLSAVDADLAVGNIKDGVTIFGFLGTYLYPALAVPHNNATERMKSSTGAYQKIKEIKLDIAFAGDIRIGFERKGASADTMYAQIYRNGGAIGTERILGSATYTFISEDFNAVDWAVNDLIQIYTKSATTVQYVKNFELSFAFSAAGYTDQDP